MRQSTLFTKTRKESAHNEVSINAQLLERAGYIQKLMAEVYSYLPLGIQVLTKIEALVRQEMNALGADEVFMPALHPKEIWEATNRWDAVDVLYRLKGAGDRDLCLGATHEEVATPLIAPYVQSYKDLPQKFYQIQTKFRNEARPKSGLLRGREFRMKDLYSFHTSQEDLDAFYEQVIPAYMNIFTRCGLGNLTYITYASGGVFSKYSHEFQTITPYGEDRIFICSPCRIAINHEIIAEQSACPRCGATELVEQTAIEVGNIFKLGTRFSAPTETTYTDAHDESHPLLMGSYGIGTSRLMGAIIEVCHDERGICWPASVAPFDLHLISISSDEAVQKAATELYHTLQADGISVLFDDRLALRPGEKFADADLIGIPWRVVISPKTLALNVVELKQRTSPDAQIIPAARLKEILIGS